jgi:hypothetical protein
LVSLPLIVSVPSEIEIVVTDRAIAVLGMSANVRDWIFGTVFELLLGLKNLILAPLSLDQRTRVKSIFLNCFLSNSPFVLPYLLSFVSFVRAQAPASPMLTDNQTFVGRLKLTGWALKTHPHVEVGQFYEDERQILASPEARQLVLHFPEFFSAPLPRPASPGVQITPFQTSVSGILRYSWHVSLIRLFSARSKTLVGFPFWDIFPFWLVLTGRIAAKPALIRTDMANQPRVSVRNPTAAPHDLQIKLKKHQSAEFYATYFLKSNSANNVRIRLNSHKWQTIQVPGNDELVFSLASPNTAWASVAIQLPLSPSNVAIPELHDEFVADMKSFAMSWTDENSETLTRALSNGILAQHNFDQVCAITDAITIPGFSQAVVRLKAMILYHFTYIRANHRQIVPGAVWQPYLRHVMIDAQVKEFFDTIQSAATGETPAIKLDRASGSLPIIHQMATEFCRVKYDSLRKRGLQPWRIQFKGEDGSDVGGLSREAFSIGARSIFMPEARLVVQRPDATCFVPFSPTAADEVYSAIGILLGMIARQGYVQDLPFADLVWKYIASEAITREDVFQAEPRLGAQVTAWELDPSAGVPAFETWDGTPMKMPAETAPVEEIAAEISRHIGGRIAVLEKFLGPMKTAFWGNVGRKGQDLLTSEALRAITNGTGEVTVAALDPLLSFEGGLTPVDKERLMRVLGRFTAAQRSDFMKYCTGLPKIPNRIVSPNFKIVVKPLARSIPRPDNFCPEAHTCFNALCMPSYSSDDIAYDRIAAAIRCEEIGLF